MFWSRSNVLSGKVGTRWGSGVVARVSTVLSLLLLLSLLARLRKCLGGRCLGARLEEKWEWELMLSWLFWLAFYPRADASRDIFLSVAVLGRYQRAPTYCRSLGIPST